MTDLEQPTTLHQHMQATAQILLHLKAISPDVAVRYSEYTGMWYVEARHLAIGDGCLASGATEHRNTPSQAIQAMFQRLISTGPDQYVIGNYRGQRREYRWNGAAFAEVTRPEVLAQQSGGSRG